MGSQRVKNHKKWQPELKAHFERLFGYEFCEKCGTTEPPIDMAHRMKRIFIKDKGEFFMAAMLCRACHNDLEHSPRELGGHQRMFDEISDIIARR